jgi:hypothetical protein
VDFFPGLATNPFSRPACGPRLLVALAKSLAARHNVTPAGPVIINGDLRMTHRIRLILILLIATVCSPAAFAVIKVTNTVAKMYNEGSSIVVGKVTRVNDNGMIEAAVMTLKGEDFGDTLKIVKIENLPEVSKAAKEGSPLVLIIARRASASALHLANHWLYPEFLPTAKSNLVVRKELNLGQSFPGATSGLAAAMQSLKEGKYSMLDAASPDMFKGEVKNFGKLEMTNLKALFPARVQKERQQGVFALSQDGLRIYVADVSGLKATEEPNSAPLHLSFQSTDLIALTLTKDGYYLALTRNGELEEGRPNTTVASASKAKLWSDGSTASAAAFGNFGEEPDRLYAIVVKDDNVYRYPLDGKGEPADFVRLTGERVSTYHKENPKWLAGATACALDCNGDGRMDVLINTPSGPMLLINRGYGAFFINADLGKILKATTGEPLLTDKTLWTAADVDGDGLDDLIIVSPGTGAVTAVMNPKPEEKH